MSITIIGDVHGHYNRYLKLTRESEYTVQIGDMGFRYHWMHEEGLDANRHKFFFGNHDNHSLHYYNERIPEYNHLPESYLGKYGIVTLNGVTFFFIGGAFSIDCRFRTPGYDWFENEELSENEWEECFELYKKTKPDILLSHDCPWTVSRKLFGTQQLVNYGWSADLITMTGNYLQILTDYHKPKIHVFGHYHINTDQLIGSTRYVCVGELQTFTLE